MDFHVDDFGKRLCFVFPQLISLYNLFVLGRERTWNNR